MKRFNAKADARVADETAERSTLMCKADGCPNRWTVSGDSGPGAKGLCSAHAWADEHAWPLITREQLDAQTDRAMALQNPTPALSGPKPNRAEIIAKLKALRLGEEPPRAWIGRLQERQRAGFRLTDAQREIVRGAAKAHLAPEGTE